MQSTGMLRRKDTTQGPPLRILSLDGGGVRGYSLLILLQELMHRTFVEIYGRAPKRQEIPRPCDHFDLIAGTGTGGLIAIMLGRLRLDLDTCKQVYVRMTRRVFETDKTLFGVPLRNTMFKASKLEEAIRECVAQHTVYEDEGNDVLSLAEPQGSEATDAHRVRRTSTSSRHSSVGSAYMPPRSSLNRGDPDALLYDQREARTKTAVTAMLKASEPQAASTTFLRSYDSRREPAPDVNCTIWEAGRATCATGLAFKPIQIGDSLYHDDGEGTFNPTPEILDEATINEWPGRPIGVLVSIGTGKRPADSANQQHIWWESFAAGAMGEFAEARRRLLAKIEGCEDIHRAMLSRKLVSRGVDAENYFRLNVEVGVGDFKMNEWNRLSEISTSTRVYLSRPEVTAINNNAATKLARIHVLRQRNEKAVIRGSWDSASETPELPASEASFTNIQENEYPDAVELPTDDMPITRQHPSYPDTPDDIGRQIPITRRSPPRNSPPRRAPPYGSPPIGSPPRGSPPLSSQKYSIDASPPSTRQTSTMQQRPAAQPPLSPRLQNTTSLPSRRQIPPAAPAPAPPTLSRAPPAPAGPSQDSSFQARRMEQRSSQRYGPSQQDQQRHQIPARPPPLPPKTPLGYNAPLVSSHTNVNSTSAIAYASSQTLSAQAIASQNTPASGGYDVQGGHANQGMPTSHAIVAGGIALPGLAQNRARPPYPDADGPPPAVDFSQKPQMLARS